MSFARFMAGSLGRLLRVVAGLALMLVGTLVLHGAGAIVVTVVGAVPLLAGLFNVCLLGPLLGAPLRGSELLHSP